jgi:hypothetical protein
VVLGGEPTDVADLAEEGGGQHRPDAEQPDQAGVGLGNRRLDARLDRGDPLLQVTDVGDELAGQLPAGDRWRSGRRDRGQQDGGPFAVRLRWAPPGTRSISSRCSRLMGLGTGGDQVLASLGQAVVT